MTKVLSGQGLKEYLEAERKEIIKQYGKLTDETIRQFIQQHEAEKFHERYFSHQSNS